MSKGFKISLVIIFIFIFAIGYVAPAFLIYGYSSNSYLEKDVRVTLSPIENLLVLKVVDDGPAAARLYTWFGLAYGRAKNAVCDPGYGGCSTFKGGLVIDRFWTQKDNIKY